MIQRIEQFQGRASMLLDDPGEPSALMLIQGGMLALLGEASSYRSMFSDLLRGNVEPGADWPAEHFLKSMAWQSRHEGYSSLFLNTVPIEGYQAAIEAGFQPHPTDEGSPPARLYYFRGEPRFAHLVQHPCRTGKADELLPYMTRGISYDKEGHYTKMCLENGPSFVCEVEGQPVCWSCTHLNGTMGMIYTPAEHRRRGYAKSLAAFQIDHMLELEEFACCNIVEGNTASIDMVMGLGALTDDTEYCWRSVLWPEDLLPQLPEED